MLKSVVDSSIMRFQRGNFGYLFAFMLTGAILVWGIASLAAVKFPGASVLKKDLFGPIGFSSEILSLSFRLNPALIAGLVLGLLVFRKV